MIERRGPQAAEIFLDDFGRRVAVLEPGDGRFEVAGIGETVGADRSELGRAGPSAAGWAAAGPATAALRTTARRRTRRTAGGPRSAASGTASCAGSRAAGR